VQRLCCAASAPQHTAGLPWAAAARPAAAQPRRSRGGRAARLPGSLNPKPYPPCSCRARPTARGAWSNGARAARGAAGQAAGAQPASGPGAPGHPPRAARGGCMGAWPSQAWAHGARSSRVRAYVAVSRAVSAHTPGWPQKTHNSPAHATSPVSGRSAHRGRSYVFCSAPTARATAGSGHTLPLFAP
jgi:hypothetical protein